MTATMTTMDETVAAPPRVHTVLVLDDEPDVARSVRNLLRLDYRVLVATNVKDAMEFLEKEEIHVIMTDQRMPDMSGVEFLKRVKGDHPDAIRLLFTGYADIHAVIDAINQGNVFRYITKPCDPGELQSIIHEAITRYDLIVERKKLLADVQQKNQALEQVNAQLAEANRVKTAFIQVASHELRTPVSILSGLLRLLIKEPTRKVDDLLPRLMKTSDRLQHLVDQITTMLAVGRFNVTLERQNVDVGALLKQACDDVRPFIMLRGQTLEVAIPDDLGEAELDAFQIQDSVNHVLLNAIKFTPDKGTISLAARATPQFVEIEVKDTGIGIPAEERARLFEPFFTGFDVSRHSSGSFEYNRRGLGLGLVVVKSFIDMHGGEIEVTSKEREGTVVVMRLPRKGGAEAVG